MVRFWRSGEANPETGIFIILRGRNAEHFFGNALSQHLTTSNPSIVIHRPFHVAKKHRGRKELHSGVRPVAPTGRVPRISRLLALAYHCRDLVRSGAVINQSELAYFGQISTNRMKQIMWLDNLASDIQEEILFLPPTTHGRDPIKEADLRPIAKTFDWNEQREMWIELKSL